ncbi:MAG: hypothetical protein HC881_07295 [Leptolyngbyaceae cyanobacterium SL_7_1]|nr:hypothetical protein [Leptolyngbyaceae cyanobacterium SL_7_1]
MTTKADYTEAEWKTLYLAPIACGFAVAMSDFGIVSSAIEGAAMGKELAQASAIYPQNPLIQELFPASRDATEQVKVSPSELGENPQAAMDRATALVTEAMAILASKASSEIADYKSLCLSVADRVANAAGSGLFGSGTKVSPEEATAIEKLKATMAL